MSDSQKNAAPFPHWQASLMQKTGLPEEDFRRLRNRLCQRDVHFRVGKLNHIEFTDEGARVMMEAAAKNRAGAPPLASRAAPDVPSNEDAADRQLTPDAPIPAPQDVPLTVEKLWPLNPRCLTATTAPGQSVTVRVKDNRSFRRGLAITGRLVTGTIYDLSSKPPRQP